MDWKQLQHQATPYIVKGVTAIAGYLLLKYKKQIEAFGSRLEKRFLGPPVTSNEALLKELQELCDAGAERIESLLYMVLRDPNYLADRATITFYELQEDGTALGSCEAEVRVAEMVSVRKMKKKPFPADLIAEIWKIEHLPDQVLYVRDARAAMSPALRNALPASGVFSAFYQLMPASLPTERRLLAVSWHKEHLLDMNAVSQLRLSGIACAAVLDGMLRAMLMQEKLRGSASSSAS